METTNKIAEKWLNDNRETISVSGNELYGTLKLGSEKPDYGNYIFAEIEGNDICKISCAKNRVWYGDESKNGIAIVLDISKSGKFKALLDFGNEEFIVTKKCSLSPNKHFLGVFLGSKYAFLLSISPVVQFNNGIFAVQVSIAEESEILQGFANLCQGICPRLLEIWNATNEDIL